MIRNRILVEQRSLGKAPFPRPIRRGFDKQILDNRAFDYAVCLLVNLVRIQPQADSQHHQQRCRHTAGDIQTVTNCCPSFDGCKHKGPT